MNRFFTGNFQSQIHARPEHSRFQEYQQQKGSDLRVPRKIEDGAAQTHRYQESRDQIQQGQDNQAGEGRRPSDSHGAVGGHGPNHTPDFPGYIFSLERHIEKTYRTLPGNRMVVGLQDFTQDEWNNQHRHDARAPG